MDKHTPGPWDAYTTTHVGTLDTDGKTICHASAEIDDDTPANMKLIAAAPDLLEIAEDYLAVLWDERHSHYTQAEFDADPDVTKVRAAIKKARGE